MDDTGRTLRESRSIRFKPARSDFVTKSASTGQDKIVNMAAMRHYLLHKDSAERYIQSVCSQIREMDEKDQFSGPLGTMRFLLFTSFVLFKAPQYWIIREWYGISNEKTPAAIAAVSKIAEGLLDVMRDLIVNQKDCTTHITSHFLYAKFLEIGSFEGRNEMCPASEEIICHFLDLILQKTKPSLRQEDVNKTPCTELLDFANLCWSAEHLAIDYSVKRLTLLSARYGIKDVSEYAHITFPYSIDVLKLCKNNCDTSSSRIESYLQYQAAFLGLETVHDWHSFLPQTLINNEQPESLSWKLYSQVVSEDFCRLQKTFASSFGIPLGELSAFSHEIWFSILGKLEPFKHQM